MVSHLPKARPLPSLVRISTYKASPAKTDVTVYVNGPLLAAYTAIATAVVLGLERLI